MEQLAVSTREAGKMLGVSHDTIERLVRQGVLPRLPHVAIIRIPVAALRRYASGEAA